MWPLAFFIIFIWVESRECGEERYNLVYVLKYLYLKRKKNPTNQKSYRSYLDIQFNGFKNKTLKYYLKSIFKKMQSNQIRINRLLKLLHTTESLVTLWQALLYLVCCKVAYSTNQPDMCGLLGEERWFLVLIENWFPSAVLVCIWPLFSSDK